MSYRKEPTDSNLEKAVYPYFVLKNKTLRNDLIKRKELKIVMLVLLLVRACAPRLTAPLLKIVSSPVTRPAWPRGFQEV